MERNARKFVDLHTHSTASDGSLRPAEIIDLAEKGKLAAVALTDHDTTVGLAEARARAKRYPELCFISGIEISAVFPTGVLHILGLGIDESPAPLAAMADQLRQAREERNPKIIARLREMGLDIDMDDVLAAVPGSHDPASRIVSRMHIAQTMLAKGYVRKPAEAFERYIGTGAPAFVDKEHIAPAAAIAALRTAGGLAALAHPPQLQYENSAQLDRIVRELMAVGLNAIECYHSSHTAEQTRACIDLAKKYDLAIVGGSDFHGMGKPDVSIGRPRVPVSMIPASLLPTI